MIVAPGATSVSVTFRVFDDSGLPVSGLVAATLPSIYWAPSGGDGTLITLSDLATVGAAWSSGGVHEKAGTAAAYRLCVPDAAFASADTITIYGEASGKRVVCESIVVANVPADLQTIKTQTVTCGAAVTIEPFVGTATAAIAVDGSGHVTAGTVADKTGYSLTVAPLDATGTANAVWDALTGAHATAGSFGVLVKTDLDATISSRMATYTQPAGFLAASFPTTVASPTNITAGTITTVSGDVEGKVLGGGASALTGTGVRAVDASGNALATAANQTTIITDVGLCQQAGAAVTLPANPPANFIDAAGIAAGALDGKGDWATAGAQMDLVSAPNATALAAIANAYLGLADGIEVGITPLQAERAMLAALCGILASSGANPEVFKNPAGTATRVSVANDSAGNRTAVTITA